MVQHRPTEGHPHGTERMASHGECVQEVAARCYVSICTMGAVQARSHGHVPRLHSTGSRAIGGHLSWWNSREDGPTKAKNVGDASKERTEVTNLEMVGGDGSIDPALHPSRHEFAFVLGRVSAPHSKKGGERCNKAGGSHIGMGKAEVG